MCYIKSGSISKTSLETWICQLNHAFLYFREIEEVYAGQFPQLHTQSTCRCLASHPRVHPLVERYCIPNAANDTTHNKVLRLNQDAHPLHYINDNDIGTTWISSVFTTLELLDKGITITIDLENGQYQVHMACWECCSRTNKNDLKNPCLVHAVNLEDLSLY